MLPACLRKIVPVPSVSGLGSGARDPGRSRWSPPGQPAGGVAPASWGDVVGSAKRRRRAARRRQSRTRRCKVRSWPGRNTPGCSRQRRSKSSFAVRCGSVSSHWTIRGQLVSNGSCRVRQCRGGLWRARWVGRTSPARHASARLRREPVEVGVTFRHRMDRRPRGEGGEMMLDGPNLVQQRERVHRTEHRAQPVLRRNGNRVQRQQARARRLRRRVALPNTAAVARLLRQLERRLEDVHEQARRRVEAGQRLGCRHALQAAVPDHPANDGAVLLLDPGLVVLPIRPGPCELNALLPAEGHQHLVDELAAVVRVDPAERERQRAAQMIQRVDHQACFAHQERDALRPPAGDVGQHQRPDETAGQRPAAVRDEICLDETRSRVFQSPNVRTGTLPRNPFSAERRRRR